MITSYLLPEFGLARQDRKYLILGLYALTLSQIYSRPALPLSQ